jgi:hypothetical protein
LALKEFAEAEEFLADLAIFLSEEITFSLFEFSDNKSNNFAMDLAGLRI